MGAIAEFRPNRRIPPLTLPKEKAVEGERELFGLAAIILASIIASGVMINANTQPVVHLNETSSTLIYHK